MIWHLTTTYLVKPKSDTPYRGIGVLLNLWKSVMKPLSVWTSQTTTHESGDYRQGALEAASALMPFKSDGKIRMMSSARDGASATGAVSTAMVGSKSLSRGSVMRISLESGIIRTSCASRGYRRVERFANNVSHALNLPLEPGDSLVYVREDDASDEAPIDWASMADHLQWNVIVTRHLTVGSLRIHAFLGASE